jgi:hypothetical protein
VTAAGFKSAWSGEDGDGMKPRPRKEGGSRGVWEWKDLNTFTNIKGHGFFIFGKIYQGSTFGTRNVELPSQERFLFSETPV